MSNVTGSERGQVATRRVDNLRNNLKVTELVKQGQGYLTDLSGNHEVHLDWKLNEQAIKDGIFKLTVGDKEVYLDIEELYFYTRVFGQK